MFTTEAQRQGENREDKDPRTGPIIGAAIEVHRHLGPELSYLHNADREASWPSHQFQRSIVDQGHHSKSSPGLYLSCGFPCVSVTLW
jgi:hypothetical protein